MMLPGVGIGHTEIKPSWNRGLWDSPAAFILQHFPCSQHQVGQLRVMWDLFGASLQPPAATAGLVLLQSRALGKGPTVLALPRFPKHKGWLWLQKSQASLTPG